MSSTSARITLSAVFALALAGPAAAQSIIAPVSAVANASSGSTPISNTIDQSGLSAKYVSGVTNFNSYIAGNPLHSFAYNNEWFGDSPATTAQVTYDFGALVRTDALALWNEDAAGFGSALLSTSNDGVTFAPLATISPADNPTNVDYGAQVFAYTATTARYVRFAMSGCPQSGTDYQGCAIGEVAFRSVATGTPLPELSTWSMMLGGVGAAGIALRRRAGRGLRLA